MKALTKISLDAVFKICMIIFLGYLLSILTLFFRQHSEIGRYQFFFDRRDIIIDTKTGSVYEDGRLEYTIEK